MNVRFTLTFCGGVAILAGCGGPQPPDRRAGGDAAVALASPPTPTPTAPQQHSATRLAPRSSAPIGLAAAASQNSQRGSHASQRPRSSN